MKYNKPEKTSLLEKISLRKKKNSETSVVLCEGISLDEGIYEKKENRIWPLFMKGILVYLICAGTIGSVLTAAGTPYDPFLLHFIIFTTAVGFSCMYYRKLTANIGALFFLFITVFLAFRLNRYINSGFYAVLNDLNDHASTYFNLNGVRVFTEQINNRSLATTISMSFLGIVGSMVLTITFMYWMRYLSAAILVLPLLVFPVYIGREPSLLYLTMILMGVFGAYAWRRAGHYEKADADSVYRMDKKGRLRFRYHRRALFSFLSQTFLCVLAIVIIVMIINPKEAYLSKPKMSGLKQQTKDTVENFVLLGVSGFINRYENTGGMNSGRLGGVSSVNLDYNTDYKLRITPYSYDTVYLKSFAFGEYVPYENRWVQPPEGEKYPHEAEQLRNAFRRGKEGSAEGKAEVEDVANMTVGKYMPYPYYSGEGQVVDNNNDIIEYTFYPRLSANAVPVEQEIDLEYWLQIPDANYEVIAKFCEEAGFGDRIETGNEDRRGSDAEIIMQVKTYFQREIPYTLRPGVTPRRQDFINFFLEENRKGYCAYFASAATLIFRYYGIPARYVEGYAVSYDEMLDGTLVEGAEYADYYKGYSELGETGLVEVELTDADAHAWVEVYDEKYGWVPVEVTPYSTSTEEMRGMDFWSMFLRFLDADEEQPDEVVEEEKNAPTTFDFKINTKAVWSVLILIAAAVVMLFLVRQLLWQIRYCRADMNDRLILSYKRYLRKKTKRYPLLSEKRNYREQIRYLAEESALTEDEKEEIIKALEKAGFSNHSITAEEDKLVRRMFSTGFFA